MSSNGSTPHKKIALTLLGIAALLGIALVLQPDHETPRTPPQNLAPQKDPVPTAATPTPAELSESLKGNDPARSRLAAASVGDQAIELEALRAGLTENKDSATRLLIAAKLRTLRTKEAVKLLLVALDDSERSVREEAARSLEELIGFQIKLDELNDPYLKKEEIARARTFWQQNEARPIEELRLEALKNRSRRP